MSAKSMYKAKPVKKEPRSVEEINKEYTAYAQLLGDKQVKIRGLNKDVDQLLGLIDALGMELIERQKLDAPKIETGSPDDEVKS
jgi:hypothetical protein